MMNIIKIDSACVAPQTIVDAMIRRAGLLTLIKLSDGHIPARRYAGAPACRRCARRPSRRRGGGCAARTWTRAA